MDQQTSTIVEVIQEAPGWVRVGIAAPSAGMREHAAVALAKMIAGRLDPLAAHDCAAQLQLAI